MPRRNIEDRNIRKIGKMSGRSYYLTLPIEQMREIGWQDGQKVVVEKKGKTLVIKDWKNN